MEYYPAIRKKEIRPFATMWMNAEGIRLSEISETEKGKWCMLSHIEKKKKLTLQKYRMMVINN